MQNDINMKQVLQAFDGIKRGQSLYAAKVAEYLRHRLEEESQALRTATETTQIFRQQGKCQMIQDILKHIDNAEILLKNFESQ